MFNSLNKLYHNKLSPIFMTHSKRSKFIDTNTLEKNCTTRKNKINYGYIYYVFLL